MNDNAIINVDKNQSAMMQVFKDSYFKNCTPEEFELFKHICKHTGLDPALKQIYPVKRWDSALKREVMSVQVSIDGYRLIAERTGKYAPGKESVYTYDKDSRLQSVTVYVKKKVDNEWHEVSATAFMSEYAQRTKEGVLTSIWAKMPHVMLAKCAESMALRKAFPAELSSVYTKEEMEQADTDKIEIVVEENKLSIEEVNEWKKSICDKLLIDKILLDEYIIDYSKHWKKSIENSVYDLGNDSEFQKKFERWKTQKVK